MTKSAATQSDTTTVGAQLIAPEASPEHGQKGGVSGWRECKLDNAPLEIVDGDRGKNYPSQNEFFDVGHCLFLSTKNVRFNGFDFSDCQFITREKDELLRKGKLRRNDVILTTRGTVGNLGFYGDSIAYENVRINSGMVIIRPNTDNLYPLFNFYLFRHLQSDFQTHTSGSAQPQLPIRDLKEMYVSIPPLPEQKAIAAVLSSLDDKIDLLHRQNQTLEAMAQTLFRQWFIEEAREDWEEVPLSILFEISSGKGLSKENFLDDGIYRVLGANGIIGRTDNYNFFEKLIYTGRVGTLGNIFIINTEPVWLSDNTLVMRNIKYFYFTYFTLKNSNLKDYNAGSTQPLLRQSDLKVIPYLQPPVEKMQEFESFAAINFTKIETNTKQIQTLNQLRDTLLPKLMSGEVRVEIVTETINGFN